MQRRWLWIFVLSVWTPVQCLAGTAFSIPPQQGTRTLITAVSPNPSVVGQSVRVSFRVEPTGASGGLTPTGDVSITGAAQCKAPVKEGDCSLIVHEAGTATLIAIYYGDRNFTPSTSTQAINLQVIAASSGPGRTASGAGNVGSGLSNIGSYPTTSPHDSVGGAIMQAVRENPIVWLIDLIAIVLLGGGILFFLSWVVRRELARKNRRPRPQVAFAVWFVTIVLVGIIIPIVAGGGDNLSKDQVGVAINGWLVFSAGIALVFYGLSTFRLYRFFFDTAVSTIRSLAMGFVEVSGSAIPSAQPAVPSPIFEKPCFAYQVNVEIGARVVGEAQDVDWSDYFADRPGGRFYLQDKTGKVLVDTLGAHFDFLGDQCEIRISPSGTLEVSHGHASEAALATYLSADGTPESGERNPFKPGHRYRLTERGIHPFGSYTIAGTCAENPEPKDELDGNMIVKGHNERTFEISRQRESVQQDHLLRRAKLAIYGGATLAAVSLAMVLAVLYL